MLITLVLPVEESTRLKYVLEEDNDFKKKRDLEGNSYIDIPTNAKVYY